jgi:hypothetical protein
MAQNKQTQFDSEYSALMAELGEGAAPGAANVPAGAVTAAPTQDRLPPWRIPENWMPGELSPPFKGVRTNVQETDNSKVDLLKAVKATSSLSRASNNPPHTVTVVVATTNNNKVKVVTANNLLQVVIHMLRKSIDALNEDKTNFQAITLV